MDTLQEEKRQAQRKKWDEIQRQGIWAYAFKVGSLQWGGIMSVFFIAMSLFPVKSTTNYWVFVPTIIGIALAIGFFVGLFMWWVLNRLHKRADRKNRNS